MMKNKIVSNKSLAPVLERDETFIKTWLDGKSEKTVKAYINDIEKLYAFTGKPLRGLTLEDLQKFKNIGLIDLKPSSRARTINAVKSALSFAIKTGYLTFNVGAVVKSPRLEDKLAERIISEQQLAKLLALETDTRNHAILVLLYRGGLRAAELCSLTWRNLQDRNDAGQIAVFGKGNKTRFILLDTSTWEELQALQVEEREPDEYVFRSRQAKDDGDRRLDESSIWRIVRAAARRSGLSSNVSPHWMRHAHASHALERGASIALVKETLGHSNIATTGKYLHVRPGDSSTRFLGV